MKLYAGCLLTVLVFTISPAEVKAAGIYKWVDAEGNVHYGEQAPPQGAKQLHIRSAGRTDKDSDSSQAKTPIDQKARRDKMIQALEGERLARQEKKQKLKKEQQKRKMQCAQAKDTLRRYRRASSLYKLDQDGNRQTLSDSIKQQETQRLQAAIDKWCK